jgi:hypothetical protein
MKANELRIGNWFIEYDEPQKFDGDCKITYVMDGW